MKIISRTFISKSISAFVMCSAPLFATAEVVVLKAANIITMDEKNPRAQAIAFDTDTKKITAVGSLKDVQASAPSATVKDLGTTVLMPGFIDPHNHPFLSGITTQAPAYWIA